MKVLGIYGSPRKGGNTDVLLDEFLKGVGDAMPTAEIERIYVRDLKIEPCKEYNVCLKTGSCIIKDDMTELYGKLITAERIALAAPVFFYSLPAQAKALVDRCQALWARKYILNQLFPPAIHPRRGFFLSLGGSNGENLFTGIGQTVRYFFDAIGVDYAGKLFFRQIDSKNDITQHPTALKEAFAAGQKFIAGS